ncbi:MAG: MerR family transcriptional regulator [Chloroflexi bacterium]|nr:MerR family transcriptional regulator [Chloroflexota bacterium]
MPARITLTTDRRLVGYNFGMFKIGDFSQLAQVSVRTLRLYDEMNLLKPAQIDKFTSYRYYTSEQLPRLNRILALKDLGLSLEQIGDLLQRDLPADQLRGMLILKQAEMEQDMQAMQAQMRRVEQRLKQIEQEGTPPPYDVVIKSVGAQKILSVRGIVPHVKEMPDYRYRLYQGIYTWLDENQIEPLEPEMAIYHLPEYVETDIDMELATPIDPKTIQRLTMPEGVTVRDLPAVEAMACIVHRGDIWGIVDALIALYRWIGEHGFASAGPYRELHHGWREYYTDESKFGDVVLEMQIPVMPM